MASLARFTTARASSEQLDEIRELLDVAFLDEFTSHDWDNSLGGWHVVARDQHSIAAHASVVHRVVEIDGEPFDTGYVEAVATHPSRRGEGLGSRVMAAVNDLIGSIYELGALSSGRHDFYGRLGWERWLGSTYVRDGSNLVRTEDEDDGVMVLRFGASKNVDLFGAITCEARPGDDW